MSARYLTIDELLQRMDEPYKSGCQNLFAEHRNLFQTARSSSNNHQAWTGGYIDHLHEVMNIAVVFYNTLNKLRPLPFPLSDALVVLFVHDLEKPWAYTQVEGTWRRNDEFRSKEDTHAFRLKKLGEYGLQLPTYIERAIFFAEGELHHYSNRERAMSPLAAFCNICDVTSARLWHDRPLKQGDSCIGTGQFRT
ncbi:hypothetical protein H6F96_04715 [Microcoleus sp. FACHB-53]|nr:hypothetical protein [Microcoleus sp. FACHB-53]